MGYGQQPPSGRAGKKERPTSITILAILYVIGGLIYLGMGAYLGIAGSLFMLPELGLICFAIPAIIGVVEFLIAYGLWTGQGWARIVAIIFAVIGLLGFPIGTIISIVILIFLFKDETKAYFKDNPPQQQQGWQRQSPQQQPPQQQQQQQPQQQPTQQPTQQPSQQDSETCPDCGQQMRYIDDYDRWYCDSCGEYK